MLSVLIALASGLIVLGISIGVFPYHSSNHDEGVYLMQAALLLNGQLELSAGHLADAFRPWFFIQDGSRLYPKYAPIPATFYALSIAVFDTPRVALGLIAAGNTYLIYRLGTIIIDRRTGIIASVIFATAPLALLSSAVFLPYTPSTFLHLVFAVAYLRSTRDNAVSAALIAGIAIGLAFFARPYTAVLFATPFIIHATYQVLTTLRQPATSYGHRHLITAIVGAGFVLLTLGYNARMTGSPLVFPYEAFAPLDGPGFGERRILSHSITYTPALALEANAYVLWYFATRWFTAGPIGTFLALTGVYFTAKHCLTRSSWPGFPTRTIDQTAALLIMAVVPSVILGNLLFWGNYNILATMTDPTDGLLSRFGPFYHFDLLVPLSLFTTIAITTTYDYVKTTTLPSPISSLHNPTIRSTTLVIFLLIATLTTGLLLASPLESNYSTTQHYENAYQPFEETNLDNALVFLPTPYGDWQHHPFQYLRNDPDLHGPTVYALDRGPDNFPVTDAYPNRSYYRYTYRGTWATQPATPITPVLEPISIRTARTHHATTHIDLPDRVTHAIIRLSTDTTQPTQTYEADLNDSLTIPLRITPTNATLRGTQESATVSHAPTDTIVLTITLVQPDGATQTYRQEIHIRTNGNNIDIIWPPDRYVCSLTLDCGNEGRYIPTTDSTLHTFTTELDTSD